MSEGKKHTCLTWGATTDIGAFRKSILECLECRANHNHFPKDQRDHFESFAGKFEDHPFDGSSADIAIDIGMNSLLRKAAKDRLVEKLPPHTCENQVEMKEGNCVACGGYGFLGVKDERCELCGGESADWFECVACQMAQCPGGHQEHGSDEGCPLCDCEPGLDHQWTPLELTLKSQSECLDRRLLDMESELEAHEERRVGWRCLECGITYNPDIVYCQNCMDPETERDLREVPENGVTLSEPIVVGSNTFSGLEMSPEFLATALEFIKGAFLDDPSAGLRAFVGLPSEGCVDDSSDDSQN
ncbi:hypothetical protein CMI47_00930 [Candidatus Pacearchaeota archaeon]|nr:hypothetical protein [Candidatus Pacearchaeota archaeon]